MSREVKCYWTQIGTFVLEFNHANLISPKFKTLNFYSYLMYHHSHTLKCLVQSPNCLPPVLAPLSPLHPAVNSPSPPVLL